MKTLPLMKTRLFRILIVAALLAAVVWFSAACGHRRVAPFSPRRPDTADHRAAKTAADCVECHDPTKIRDHAPGDKCLTCHNRIPGR